MTRLWHPALGERIILSGATPTVHRGDRKSLTATLDLPIPIPGQEANAQTARYLDDFDWDAENPKKSIVPGRRGCEGGGEQALRARPQAGGAPVANRHTVTCRTRE